jgi:cAMP-dependent protein kinase regulator
MTVASPIGAQALADRALGMLASADRSAALGLSIPLCSLQRTRPISLFVLASCLGALGREQPSRRAFTAAARHALGIGNVSLAIACCIELRERGADAEALTLDVARAIARGSELLLADGVRPPELPDREQTVQPLTGSEAQLADAAEDALATVESDAAPAALPPHALFSKLDAESLVSLIGILDVALVAPGERLIEQGTTGAEAFIVARGELEVVRESGDTKLQLARVGHGALIGEMALLSRAPRAASVVACRPSVVLVARKERLERVATDAPRVAVAFAEHCRRRMVDNLLRTSSILSAVSPPERPALVRMFVTRTFETGDKLIAQGQESDGLDLIASGEVSVIHRAGDEGTLIATLGPGEVVGEVALVLRRPSNAEVVANHPTVTLHLPRETFLEAIRKHPALLAKLYESAVQRDEETSSIVAQEASTADDVVLL